MANELVSRDVWPRLPSLLSEDFWPQLFNQSGLSLSEDDEHVYVEAAVPGLEAKDISLSFHQGTLTVSGEHAAEERPGKRQYRSMKAKYSYQVALPSQVLEDKEPAAKLKSGILSVRFEKAPEAKPKQIKINSEAKTS